MASKIEFTHQIFCGTHRFYPKSRYAEKLCKLAQRKCMRTLDLQLLLEINIGFEVLTHESEGPVRVLEYDELMKILKSPYKEPKSETKTD